MDQGELRSCKTGHSSCVDAPVCQTHFYQGLLAVPFVLSSQPEAVYHDTEDKDLAKAARSAKQRYADIFRDVEHLIANHSRLAQSK